MILCFINPKEKQIATRKNLPIERRKSLLSIPYLFAFRRNNREITFPSHGYSALWISQNSLILLSCKRDGFTDSTRLFRARESRQFGQRICEKFHERKSLHSFSAFDAFIDKESGKKRRFQRKKVFFATWRIITSLERSSFSLFLSPSPLETFN